MQNCLNAKRVAPFTGQCNLRFLSTKVLQGSGATRVNYCRLEFRGVTGKNKVAPGIWTTFPKTIRTNKIVK